MPATPVKIGPFAGGLNTYSGPTSVADNEVVDIRNFDIDLDGSLYSRAPFILKEHGDNLPGAGAFYLLGWYLDHTDGAKYLIGSCSSGVYARNELTGVWTTITTTFQCFAYVQYANKGWLISPPGNANPGGSWDPTAGFTAIAAIPHGRTCCIYKERLFVSGTDTYDNRVYFSDPANFPVFQTTVNFFDARAGDGQNVIRILVFQDVILIFKEDSTYAFSYDSAPNRGAVRVVNPAIGVTNIRSVVIHENECYVHYGDKLYQLANWTFTQVNMKVPFEFIDKWPTESIRETTLSILNDRLLVHHTDAMYVFNLRNATWTRWEVDNVKYNFTQFIRVPRRNDSDEERYYAGSRNITSSDLRGLIEWSPEYPLISDENIDCYFSTKVYDFNVPYTFKRLFWWGIDMLNKSNLTYTVHPVTYTRTITHEQMGRFTHDELNNGTHLQPIGLAVTYTPVTTHLEMSEYTHEQLHGGTHLSPTGRVISSEITENIKIDNVAENRMFVKLLKGLRFRQIYFVIGGQTKGNIATAPYRIYSLVAFIDDKQLVVKKVS